MYSESVKITNKSGLHARPAVMFVQTSAKFKSDITVRTAEKSASSKSIVNILALGITGGTEITIEANGADEKEAVQALVKLVNSKFGEQ